jgi:hypothetical protein
MSGTESMPHPGCRYRAFSLAELLISFLMKRFNKIYLIDSMTKVPKWKTATRNPGRGKGRFSMELHQRTPPRGPSPGFMLAATAENV